MGKFNILQTSLQTVSCMSAAFLLWSCAAEDPFHVENEGTSLVKFNVCMNNAITRADSDPYENCRIYISNSSGLLHKWQGVGSIPSTGIYLRYGEYLAEAIAGDSVAASFSEKYFKGATKFDVSQNQISTHVSVECKLANVVTSVDASKVSSDIAKTLKVKVESTQGNLTFEGSTLSLKGYFMRYFNESNNEFDSQLKYTITGEDIDGSTFEKTGFITNVLPAHEYKIVLTSDTQVDPMGGSAIKIVVREYELEVDDTIIIHGEPVFSWTNNEIDIESQLYNKDKSFTDKSINIAAYEKFESLVLYTENETIKNALGGMSQINLVSSPADDKEKLSTLGVEVEYGQKGVYEQFSITFSSRWLNSLPSSPTEYVINLMASDKRGITNTMKIRIATSEEALDAPFAINTDYHDQNLLSVRAYKAKVAVNVYDNISNMIIRYKKADDQEWKTQTVNGSLTKGTYYYTLTELDENTIYQYQVVGGDFIEGKYKFESPVEIFKTEEVYDIPNASMDNWWLYNNKVWMPNLDSASEFWDTGNHGATLIGNENDNLTTKFTEFSHTSGACARLQSKFVGIATLGKLGSGNIFTGKYAGTSGTNGKIDFGREYNATHPSKLRVWVNYRPAQAVNRKGANNNYIKEGEYDQGQIYIAISDQIKHVDTSDATTLVTEEKAPDLFLAYGQYTFEGDFGEENELKMVEIPFNYFEKAKTIDAKYLIIVCCASKYGDYFSGGDGSLMYVDDFELVYE